MARKLVVEPISGKTFGAVITGVSLADLCDEEWLQIERAFNQYALLIFPEQFVSSDSQVAFARRFGELEFDKSAMSNHISKDGAPLSLDSDIMQINLGNEFWHTDSTYQPISSKAGLLSARTLPSSGGQTEFADMRAAYDALDQATQSRIANLSAYHSNEYSQANDIGHFPPKGLNDRIYHGEAYLRPLVKVHPATGRRSLMLGRHAFGIPGLAREESRRLVAALNARSCSEDAARYEHQWRSGDLVVWDNRCLLHRARPYDYAAGRRFLLGSRVRGDARSEAALPPPGAAAGRRALAEELRRLRAERGARGGSADAPRAAL